MTVRVSETPTDPGCVALSRQAREVMHEVEVAGYCQSCRPVGPPDVDDRGDAIRAGSSRYSEKMRRSR